MIWPQPTALGGAGCGLPRAAAPGPVQPVTAKAAAADAATNAASVLITTVDHPGLRTKAGTRCGSVAAAPPCAGSSGSGWYLLVSPSWVGLVSRAALI